MSKSKTGKFGVDMAIVSKILLLFGKLFSVFKCAHTGEWFCVLRHVFLVTIATATIIQYKLTEIFSIFLEIVVLFSTCIHFIIYVGYAFIFFFLLSCFG